MREMKNAYKIPVSKSQGKIPYGRPRYTLEDNIKIDLQEIWCGGVD
jgi:hypothetical protein